MNECSGTDDFKAVVRMPSGFWWIRACRVGRSDSAWALGRCILGDCQVGRLVWELNPRNRYWYMYGGIYGQLEVWLFLYGWMDLIVEVLDSNWQVVPNADYRRFDMEVAWLDG